MRQSSSFSLHRIATAIVDTPLTSTSAAMSANIRPPFRGGRSRGRGRRYFSDHPTSVSGDANVQSVRDSNSSFQRSADFRPINSFNYNYNRNNYNNCYYDYNSSSNNRGGSSNFRGRAPSFNRQQSGVRVQRRKPDDHRVWELAKVPPPPNSERFVVLSYNILADYLANSHRKLYFHIRRYFMNWEWRKGKILFELQLWSPDIMCFQEVDKFHDLEEDLGRRGYSGIWKMRTGDPLDGCAIFWRTTRFRLMYEECIEYNKHGMRDNVAQICVLESLSPSQNGTQMASSTSSESPNRVVICNIHVLYNPRRGEIKLGQVRTLIERAQAVSKTWDDAPVVLCGDFNCTPMSPLYNFISQQKLDISGVDRDKVSGQASAVISPPPRQYGSQPREQPAGDVASPATVENKSIDGKQSNSLENKNGLGSLSNKLQTPASLQQPPAADSLQNVPANSFEKNTDISSAENADQLLNETLKGPDSTSVLSAENVAISGLPLNEQEIKEVPISEVCSLMGNSDRFSSVAGNSDNNVVEKETRNNYSSNVSQSDETSASNLDITEKVNELSLDEIGEISEDEDLHEDLEGSLSDFSNGCDGVPLNGGDLAPEVETVDMDIPYYDPSLWTTMEIATATGDANSRILEHPLKLRSVYTEVVDSSGTRDSNGEPLVTSCNTCFLGTVDYIWRSEGLYTTKVLAPIRKDVMQRSGGFPTKKWGSDHIALVSELAFAEKQNG
ncbi:carbon catabolite repressor protein 4 homolog 6-like [Chenopodium quinoa]|uniref:carbon catabolite repressor protein 4 homolog 6-like n=1 Tax=Chenopodium quinoa TaxID=63459 RepID=UPI000B79A410|nr:carbon catabolite repressor protein 4 homolog 6-like [Chenopodium quinoa]